MDVFVSFVTLMTLTFQERTHVCTLNQALHVLSDGCARLNSLFARPTYRHEIVSTSSSPWRIDEGQGEQGIKTHLKTLIPNVISHAISAINSTLANAVSRRQIDPFRLSSTRLTVAVTQLLLASLSPAKASARFAESNTMKNISRKINLIFALADLSPSGFPVYSSHVMYTRYGSAMASVQIAIIELGPFFLPYTFARW